MSAIKILRRDGTLVSLSESIVKDLKQTFRGRLMNLVAGDYESAHKVWNGLFDRFDVEYRPELTGLD